MNILRRSTLLLLVTLMGWTAHAQSGMDSHWFFPINGALDFNSGAPVWNSAAQSNGTMSAGAETVFSQSDNNGNLLFYGDGQRLYDNNHNILSTSLGGHISGGTGAISFPDPANANEYYLFTTGASSSATLEFAKISVNGSNVTLSSTQNAVPVPAGFASLNGTLQCGEGITAVATCDDEYWLIATGRTSTSNRLMVVYSVTATGIQVQSQISIPNWSNSWGTMEASPDGTKIAVGLFTAANNGLRVFDFDPMTGTLSNHLALNASRIHGCSFSPNSRLLYGASETNASVTQYDMDAANPATSGIQVGTLLAGGSTQFRKGMQRGPDNVIYMSQHTTQMAEITQPNQRSNFLNPNACGFTNNGLILQSTSSFGLPNMVDANPNTVSLSCANCVCDLNPSFCTITTGCTVDFTGMHGGDPCLQNVSYQWNFDDNGATASAQNVSHTFSAPGTYTIRLQVIADNGIQSCFDILHQDITVQCNTTCEISSSISAFSSTLFDGDCMEYNLVPSVSVGSGGTLRWHEWVITGPNGYNFTSSAFNPPSPTSILFPTNGTYQVCLHTTAVGPNDALCDRDTTCIDIVVDCGPQPCNDGSTAGFNAAVSFCQVSFTNTSTWLGTPFVTYDWDFGDGTTSTLANPNHIYPASGTYKVCLKVTIARRGGFVCEMEYCRKVKLTQCLSVIGLTPKDLNPEPAGPALDFDVFPNPGQGAFTLTLNQEMQQGTVRIFSATGQEVYARNLQSTTLEEFDLSNVDKGLYLIQVVSRGEVITKRIIIQ